MTRREKLAWLAGVVDGEGTVTVLISRRTVRGKPLATLRIDPAIRVGMNDGNWLPAVKELLRSEGVGFVEQRKNVSRPYTALAVVTRQAVALAGLLAEFSVVKREALEIVRDWPRGAIANVYGVNWELAERKIALVERMRELMTRPRGKTFKWTTEQFRVELRRIEQQRHENLERMQAKFARGERQMPNRWGDGKES